MNATQSPPSEQGTQKPRLFSNRELFRLTLPLILQQIFSVTIGAVDTVMVAAAGETVVSGVSLISTLDTMLVLIFSSMITGGSVIVSQLLGRKEQESARAACKQLLYVYKPLCNRL